DMEHEVVGTGGGKAGHDLVEGFERAMKLLDVLIGVPLEPYLDEGLDGEAKPRGIHDGGVPLDDSRLLELADPAGAGRMSQADRLRQLDDGTTPVLLELVQQPDVGSIKLHIRKSLKTQEWTRKIARKLANSIIF